MPSRKRRGLLLLFIVAFFLLNIAGGYFLYEYWQFKTKKAKAEKALYKAFGVNIPTNYLIYGIDVSNHQQYIHWPAVKQMSIQNIKIGFVFIKATEGLNDADKSFKYNWKSAVENNITKGAYHYFLATKNGKAQAENFIKNVQLKKGDLPPVVDVEDLYSQPVGLMKQRLKECLQTLEAYYKVKPIIYTYANFYQTNLSKEFDNYPLWVANYLVKDRPEIAGNWLFWQHTDAANINGIITPVDMNVFNGDTAALRNILLK
ncbi:MAG: glycoside hydrolase [Chitinophaga sp.]|jgi:lysozyme|nr:glycoside hydrolase [Chitinophaga sp.]